MNPEKIEQSKELIRQHGDGAALLCSFGKDSMVLLHLVRDTLGDGAPPRRTAGGPVVSIIYHRQPWFAFKNEFADSIIRSWALEMHDYPPMACGVKANDKRLELVARYPFGLGAIDLPINVEPRIPRRPFVCGLEWMLRPKISGLQWKWKNVFIGHKSSDVDPYEGPVPLCADTAVFGGGVNLVFPLRHWTDDDVWDYIEANHVPYDKRRYVATNGDGAPSRRAERPGGRPSPGMTENPDKWLNPDYLHACTACIDPRETAAKVHCPKINGMVENVGAKVLRLEELPYYVEAARPRAARPGGRPSPMEKIA